MALHAAHMLAYNAYLIKMQQLLFIVADVIVGVGVMCSELDGSNVICQGSLLFIVKASQIHLHHCILSQYVAIASLPDNTSDSGSSTFAEGINELLDSNIVSSSGLYQLKLQVAQLWSRKVSVSPSTDHFGQAVI